MVKRNQSYLNRINMIADFLLVFIAYLFSAWFRLVVLNGWRENIGLSRPMIFASLGYAAGLLLILSLMGYYNSTRVRKMVWRIKTLFIATSLSTFIVTAIIFVFKIEDISRGIIVLFYILTLVLLSGKQMIMQAVLNQLRSQGYNIKHEILFGSGKIAEQYRKDVEAEPELGIVIDAAVNSESELSHYLDCNLIDEVIIALDPESYRDVTKILSVCDKYGVKYYMIPFYSSVIPSHPEFERIGETVLINVRASRLEQLGWAAMKRSMDIVVSVLGVVLLSPVFLVLAIGVKLSSPGPVLFKQERVGLNRKSFYILKFRSMVVNDDSETAWSRKNDIRITKFGQLIRKTSLDELPQLLNVLKGDMSLVGPRPELPYFANQFMEQIPFYMVKHQVKPGITGWAQVNGYRGDTSIKKRIELDLWYIDNWSLFLDIRILFMTVPWAMINHEEMESVPETDIKVIVAAHKSYWVPSDKLYIPIQVGAEGKKEIGLAFIPDNTGDNISAKNANYCELTGLYWAWKNLDCEYLGLVHYRRYFTLIKGSGDRRDVLNLDQARELVVNNDVLLPSKRHYWIETNYSQYIHAHHKEDLDKAREIIAEKYSEYLEAYDKCMKKTSGHRFNMFIMKKDMADLYCTWLFDILFELEDRLDISNYSDMDKRVFGFVSERLLDVWLETNGIKYKNIPYIFLEKENWITKGVNFVMRKLEGKRKE